MEGDQGRGQRLRGDHGAALVEAAIVLPVLALIVFGIVELGFLFRSAAVVTASSRAGARIAAAQLASGTASGIQPTVVDNIRLSVEKDLQSKSGVDTPVEMYIYQAVDGSTPTSCTGNCIKLTWNNATGHFATPTGTWANPDGCGKVLDSVGVFVRVNHAPIGFTTFFSTLQLKEKTVMRLEPRTDCTTPE